MAKQTPRRYPPAVTLLRRKSDDEPRRLTSLGEDPWTWLLQDAANAEDILQLFHSFIWRMIGADLPIARASLHVGTLHPQLYGYAWNWSLATGVCDEVKVSESVLATDAYRRNPIFHVLDQGRAFRAKLDKGKGSNDSPLLTELTEAGITDYAVIPLRTGGKLHNAITVATSQAGGFTSEEFDRISQLLEIFALHVEKHIASQISHNVAMTYLGAAAGGKVLRGGIKRGSGEAIDAVIWASDMRGFTDLAGSLTEEEMITLLNAYFDTLAGAVMAHRGEVLKFIGDGLLAVFPFADYASEREAAEAALQAARDAQTALEVFNSNPSSLSGIKGWRPLRSGIALHRGRVFFGNVGAPERLDFTVIGKAVNAVSRVEGLCKPLNRPLLITAPVASLLAEPLDSLGPQKLRGLSDPIEVFAPL